MRHILVLLLVILTSNSCGFKCLYFYKFKLPVTISPEKETYKVGDTLTVSMHLDHNMVSDTSDANFYSIPDLEPMVTTSHTVIDSFPVIEELTIENFMYDSTSLSFEFIDYSTLSRGAKNIQAFKSSTHTSFEFKTVIKHRGIHSISFHSPLRHFERTIDFEGRCSNYSIEAYIFINGQGRVINEHLVSAENQKVRDKYWEFRSGGFYDTSFFFFKVD